MAAVWNFTVRMTPKSIHILIDQRKLKLSCINQMFDTCPPTDIPNLITRFHLVKTWLKTNMLHNKRPKCNYILNFMKSAQWF